MQSYLLGIVREIEIWPEEQMVYAQPNISPGESHTHTHTHTHKFHWDVDIQTHHLNLVRRPDLIIKKNSKIVNFAVPADHRVIIERKWKKDKYFDLARELKTL